MTKTKNKPKLSKRSRIRLAIRTIATNGKKLPSQITEAEVQKYLGKKFKMTSSEFQLCKKELINNTKPAVKNPKTKSAVAVKNPPRYEHVLTRILTTEEAVKMGQISVPGVLIVDLIRDLKAMAEVTGPMVVKELIDELY